MENLVFVYGTLRKGECNHYLLDGSECLGVSKTQPVYALFDLGSYPGLSEGDSSVIGEVYRIDLKTLARLDLLEEIPIVYRRETLVTPYGVAWIYLYQDTSSLTNRISSGDWCSRML